MRSDRVDAGYDIAKQVAKKKVKIPMMKTHPPAPSLRLRKNYGGQVEGRGEGVRLKGEY